MIATIHGMIDSLDGLTWGPSPTKSLENCEGKCLVSHHHRPQVPAHFEKTQPFLNSVTRSDLLHLTIDFEIISAERRVPQAYGHEKLIRDPNP